MQVGITGHRKRPGIDWKWVEATLRHELQKLSNVDSALSSLAVGADQVFAEVALSLGVPIVAIIPVRNYERFFRDKDRVAYDRLRQRSEVRNLPWEGNDEEGFLAAGKFIVERTHVLFAVWDAQESGGLGGTADVVQYARQLSKKIIHLNPMTQLVTEIAGEGRDKSSC
jgi:hypothetical protein